MRERSINVWLPLVHPQLRTWPTTQAYALTGNRTCDPLVHRPALNPLNHTSQGYSMLLIMTKKLTIQKDRQLSFYHVGQTFSVKSQISKYFRFYGP